MSYYFVKRIHCELIKQMANEISERISLEKDKSVKGYASKVFKESSVSAVSAIVSTHNRPRKFFRILVFVLFTTGFLYQCVKFFTYILTYPTVVNIEIDRPTEYLAPAYTFCNYNSVKRSKFCSKYPNSCIYPSKDFCNTYPDYCRDNRTKVPKEDSAEHLSFEDAIDLGHESKNLLIEGAWEDPEGPFLRMNTEEQVPVACYSLGVRVDDPREARYKKTDEFLIGTVDDDKFVFDAEEKEIFYPNSKPGILFAIHSPFEAVDPFEDSIFMKPGHLYRIKMEMMREELLPHPYKTDCLNYTEKWLKAGRTGPRSQEMCRHKCMQDFFENCYNCTFMQVLYPKKTRICKKTLDEYDEIGCPVGNLMENLVFLESCLKNCKDDCSRTKFSYRVQESCITQKMMSNSTRISSHNIKVKVYFDDSEILTMRYKPQYQEVEAFSYIGGFIGIWLGISLVQVADVFESIFRITRYIFKKGMSPCSKKSEARTEIDAI